MRNIGWQNAIITVWLTNRLILLFREVSHKQQEVGDLKRHILEKRVPDIPTATEEVYV